jgi:nucleoside-diphosphate-sugar epimerase
MVHLVTGSAGLLGRRLVARLRERGETIRQLDVLGGEDTIAADLRDAGAVDDAVAGVDVVHHLAAAQRMKPQFAGLDEREIFDMNLAGVRNVLDAAARHRVRKVVWISSSAVYGVPRTVPCRESHPNRPLGAYGESKLAGEALCREAVARGLDVTVLRPMSLFGPHMTGIFVLLFEWIRTGRPVYMLGRGRNRVQMSSADDVADACLCATQRPESRGAVLNVAAAPERVPTVDEQVRALIAHAGSRSPVVHVPAGLLRLAGRTLNLVGLSPIVPEHYLLADTTFILDVDEARRRLGWEPRVDNVGMMNAAYDWYVAAGAAQRPAAHPVLRLVDAVGGMLLRVIGR